MEKKDNYKEFQDKLFQEIGDLEAEDKKYALANTLREYGLTMKEASRLYYKTGMTSRQFVQAIKAAHEK